MTPGKRLFDVILALLLLIPGSALMFVIALVILLGDGRPVLFRSERMRDLDRAFDLLKFRTMRPDPQDRGVTGGDKAARVTRTGRVLRATRLDELPQLFNILAGDMSFVGPRPPLRTYVEDRPDLYRAVLRNRPGLTGLATLVFRRHEERLLAACATPEETDRVYRTRCVPKKARLDLIYQRKRSFRYDLALLGRTIRTVVHH
jgi:lipopolysaccharide/colanic/teichoic acid biosynthesis glycosyltransferase